MTRILIIDDEESNRFTLREILEFVGHSVAEAPNGNEGLALQKSTPCDLIITDIIMPEKGGIETIRELRRNDPNLKIIAISGSGPTREGDILKRAKQVGADMVLSKPFGEAELLEVVNACLGTGKSRRKL